MEGYKESGPNRRAELFKEIDEAKRHALHEDELEPIKDEQDEITHKFLKGEVGAVSTIEK